MARRGRPGPPRGEGTSGVNEKPAGQVAGHQAKGTAAEPPSLTYVPVRRADLPGAESCLRWEAGVWAQSTGGKRWAWPHPSARRGGVRAERGAAGVGGKF